MTQTSLPKVLKYSVDPPTLVTWVNKNFRKKNPILIDMEFDSDTPGDRRLDLQLSINPIAVPRKGITRRNHYIGCTGIEVYLSLQNCEVLSWTESKEFTVNYTNSEEHIRSCELNLSPENVIGTDFVQKMGSLTLKKSRKRSYETSFVGHENELIAVKSPQSVTWMLHMHRGTKAVRDYLAGSLHLKTRMALTNGKSHAGQIFVRTANIEFFGPDNRQLQGRPRLSMYIYLKWHGIDLYNRDGLTIDFKENP